MDPLQATILRSLMRKKRWAEYSDVITPSLLTDNLVQGIYTHVESLHAKTDNDITPEALRLDIRATYRQGESRGDELLEIVDRLTDIEEVEEHAFRGSVQKFVSREYLAKAAVYIAQNLSSPDLDAAIAADYVNRAVEVRDTVHAAVLDYVDAGLPGEADVRTGVCSLGLSPKLDTVLSGGVASGELFILLAPPGRGKTSYLCAVGARAAESGRKVLHITLEISCGRVIRRYDQVLTGFTPDQWIENPRTVGTVRKRVRQAGGAAWFKNRSYLPTTPNDIKGMVTRMRAQGQDVDLVIVDYMELMKPNTSASRYRQEQRHAYGALGQELRATAVALDVPIITAWQVNREGSNVDTVYENHVSESWDIIKHADAILALNQSRAELLERQMRIGVLKQRESTARPQIYLHSNLDRCQIRELNEEVEGESQGSLDTEAEVSGVR